MTFDAVLPSLVRVCEETAGFASVACACVVRDPRGRVRLVLKPSGTSFAFELGALEGELLRELGAHFVPPIWRTDDPNGDAQRLARKALELAPKPWEAEYTDLAGTRHVAQGSRWRRLERRLTKEVWLSDVRSDAPWALADDAPAIVTFYSFKGGVGRTTALASCAWQAAEAGESVVVVDLDLEAPGMGPLLGADTDRGVLDFIVDFLATEGRSLDGMVAPATQFGAVADHVRVIPAGNLDISYLEKLARLDFVGSRLIDTSTAASAEKNPVELALVALLHEVHRQFKPRYILIDSRAGLHDLAGLSLHGLAHIDVIIGRATQQGYQGLDLTLQALGRRKSRDRLLSVVVHSLAPPAPDTPAANDEEAAFRVAAYKSFRQWIYGNPARQEGDASAPHWPRVIRSDEALERFTQIGAVKERLFSSGHRALWSRIVELSERPPGKDEP